MIDTILPVMGLTTTEAGVVTRESSGSVTTTRDDTRTERGPSGYCSALGDAMMGDLGEEGYSFQDDGKNNKEKEKIR
jgi:hypothetical protein